MVAPNTILQGRYRIIQQLGEGGMGAVYLAMDENLNCAVAVKETFAATTEHRRAFKREAELLANLSHPALPRVTDHFTHDSGQFLVMQFVPGNDLADLLALRERPFSTEKVLEWADHLLDALEELHSYKPPIIHRDIKPSNLKLTPKGKIILLDFGLAKGAAGQMSTVDADNSGKSIYGYTRNYAPLEQIRGAGTDPRSDIYSLGATLWSLLTGELPPDAVARVGEKEDDKPDPLFMASDKNPEVPKAIAAVLHQAMAINRNQRPQSAAEMRQMLKDAVRNAEIDARRRAEEEAQRKRLEEDARRKREAEEAEAERRAAEERRQREEEERRQEEERQKQFAKEEAARLAAAEEERRQQEEEERKRRDEEERQRHEAAEAARRREEEENDRKRIEAEERKRAEEEAERRRIEEERRRKEQPVTPAVPSEPLAHARSDVPPTVPSPPRTEPSPQQLHAHDAFAVKTIPAPAPKPPLGGGSGLSQIVGAGAERKSMRTIIIVLLCAVVLSGIILFWILGTRSDSQATTNQSNAQTDSQPTNQSTNNQPSPVVLKIPTRMVHVPGSEFMMGRNDSDNAYEGPAHSVRVNPFFIDAYEVTCAEFAMFANTSKVRISSNWKKNCSLPDDSRKPVTNVMWEDAAAYCAKTTGQRLPTEEEWEFAARGPDGLLYPWGKEWQAGMANAGKSSLGKMADVGKFKEGVSPFGAFDMVGNAWEWTASDLKEYPGGRLPAAIVFADLAPGELKVIRGGSYESGPNRATTTFRYGHPARGAEEGYDKTGFRCAQDAPR